MTTVPPGATTPPTMTFVQYLLPPLETGNLAVTATQAIDAGGGQGETFRASRQLFVAGPRVTLDEALVQSVFPPPGTQGEFAGVLAHVVLARPTLPWQRSPAPRGAGPPASWLALLVFDELDPPPDPVHATRAELEPSSTVFFPPLNAELGEEPSDPLTVIDVPVELFAAIAPAAADLVWTAHVRRASVSAKVAGDSRPSGGEVAVVVANRLAVPGHISTVHLVSLEGYGPYLPTATGALAALPGDAGAVRLVSLRSWTFSTIDLKEGFDELLCHVDMTPASLQRPITAVAGGAATAAATVEQALSMGYVALDHALRDGSQTVSWYRGPLLPLATSQPPAPPAESSDELLRYDPQLGMFDVSYAAAWELGRLLALHDRAYATALYRWKLMVSSAAAAALETEVIDAALATQTTTVTGEAAETQDPAHRLVRVLTQIARPAAAALAAGRPPRTTPPQRRVWQASGREASARLATSAPLALADAAAGSDQAQVVDWLARLHALHGVPFGYLVPDPRMLPPESIRFFAVDTAWVAALLDGAFAIAQTRATASADQALRVALAPHVRSRLVSMRRRLVGDTGDHGGPEQTAAGPRPLSGFFLRSAVVAGWPGMEVHGFADVAGLQPLPVIRFEQVAPALLMCLFEGALARVDLNEPPEGIHFGVDPGGAPGTWRKPLRYADGAAVGQWIAQRDPVAVGLRPPGAAGVVRIDDLAQALAPGVWSGAPPASGFTTAEFALEMVLGVQAVSFRVSA